MPKAYLTTAFRFFHGGHRPVVYGPGAVEIPEDALAHARQIKGLLDSEPTETTAGDSATAPPAPELEEDGEAGATFPVQPEAVSPPPMPGRRGRR